MTLTVKFDVLIPSQNYRAQSVEMNIDSKMDMNILSMFLKESLWKNISYFYDSNREEREIWLDLNRCISENRFRNQTRLEEYERNKDVISAIHSYHDCFISYLHRHDLFMSKDFSDNRDKFLSIYVKENGVKK